MLDIVLDTNVYVSAFIFGGAPLEIVVLAIRRHLALFVSPPILKELETVLGRKFKWPAREIRETLGAIRAFARVVTPREQIAVLTEDEPDNRILECAVEAEAHLIISGDKHLQTLQAFRGIAILSPRAFLDAYAAGAFGARSETE